MSRSQGPRSQFRVLTRMRGGNGGAPVHDVQLQLTATGSLIWAQTFSDPEQAREFEEQVETDLDHLDAEGFRSKYGVPSTA